MRNFIFCFLLAAAAAVVLQYCTSSHAKPVSVKKYLSHKVVVSCMPGAPGDDEWKENPTGIPPLRGWGNYRWNITTGNDSAQFYFNQGINMYYSFHMIEAKASFAKAISFDPGCAMAFWGLALSIGPNINFPDVSPEANQDALDAIEKANLYSVNCNPTEQALINAVAFRYSPDSTANREKLNAAYAGAMKTNYTRYPSNGDVSTLYADALMVEHPWDLYEQNQQPKSWTPPITSLLDKILARFPSHPGANHYYIHAIEASANPGKALPSAKRLSTMLPSVSHMVHMPSHIFIRTGNYKQGIDVNTSAINGFYDYSSQFPAVEELAGLYLSHNQHMQVACSMMEANAAYSIKTGESTRQGIPGFYFEEPSAFGNYIQYIHMTPFIVNLRFGNWKALLDTPMVNPSLSVEYAFQLFAKGMAATHVGNVGGAKSFLLQLKDKMKNTMLEEKYAPFTNPAITSLKISEELLKGTLEERENNLPAAIKNYKNAVEMEDAMLYNEPKDWLLPARHYLGNALLKSKLFKEAESVYLKDLYINPNNPWALYGLMNSQKGQNKNAGVTKTMVAFKKANANADITITASVFE